jgi:hypothetical protein
MASKQMGSIPNKLKKHVSTLRAGLVVNKDHKKINYLHHHHYHQFKVRAVKFTNI